MLAGCGVLVGGVGLGLEDREAAADEGGELGVYGEGPQCGGGEVWSGERDVECAREALALAYACAIGFIRTVCTGTHRASEVALPPWLRCRLVLLQRYVQRQRKCTCTGPRPEISSVCERSVRKPCSLAKWS